MNEMTNQQPESNICRVLLTGSEGFIGKNLSLSLSENRHINVRSFVHGNDPSKLADILSEVDVVIHLAGVNRPVHEQSFSDVNIGLTNAICESIKSQALVSGRLVSLIFASSTQAELDNPYGRSKLKAEHLVKNLANETGTRVVIFRFPGVFGKWCKPNYNSVVATFCYNLTRGLPIFVHDHNALLKLVYIDDVVKAILNELVDIKKKGGVTLGVVQPEYTITLGELVALFKRFEQYHENLAIERTGIGLVRALYSTYISYLPPERFINNLPQHADDRGVFVEMIKTKDSGQFSFFSVKPGVTRGSHYHHSKTEKFLVLRGLTLMQFRNLITGEVYSIKLTGEKPQVVDSIPGWAHNITNIGNEEVLVMIWANEVFDPQNPDCVPCEV